MSVCVLVFCCAYIVSSKPNFSLSQTFDCNKHTGALTYASMYGRVCVTANCLFLLQLFLLLLLLVCWYSFQCVTFAFVPTLLRNPRRVPNDTCGQPQPPTAAVSCQMPTTTATTNLLSSFSLQMHCCRVLFVVWHVAAIRSSVTHTHIHMSTHRCVFAQLLAESS